MERRANHKKYGDCYLLTHTCIGDDIKLQVFYAFKSKQYVFEALGVGLQGDRILPVRNGYVVRNSNSRDYLYQVMMEFTMDLDGEPNIDHLINEYERQREYKEQASTTS